MKNKKLITERKGEKAASSRRTAKGPQEICIRQDSKPHLLLQDANHEKQKAHH